MGLRKLLSKKLKKYFKKKAKFPKNTYQNIHTDIKVNEYHSGSFNQYHNKFCLNDSHLNFDNNVTRFRNYINLTYAEYAIRNNSIGKFLSVGASYGTSLKVITHILDEKIKDIEYFIIDNYQDVGNLNYNTDINNIKKDLKDIKNFKFIFIEELLTQLSFDKVEKDLIFTHLNTGNFQVEFEFLPQILNKTKSKGIVIIDNFGFWHPHEQEKLNNYISKNLNLFKIVFPSCQCVIIKL